MARKRSAKKKSSLRRKSQSRQRVWMGWAALVFIALLAAIVYAFNRPPTIAQEISVEEAYRQYQAGAFLLDVREVDEWNEYRIPGTTLIPLGELLARVNELPKDQPIVVVCRSGNRSQEGRDILLEAGFEDVVSMEGGVSTWRSLGYPIEP